MEYLYAIFSSSIGKKYLFIDIYSEKNTAIKEPNKLTWLYKVFVIEFITDCLQVTDTIASIEFYQIKKSFNTIFKVQFGQ